MVAHCMLYFLIFLESALDIDGAYFGTTFPHLFLMTYGQLKPQKPSQNYVPRVFGFKLHKPWSWKFKLPWKEELANVLFNTFFGLLATRSWSYKLSKSVQSRLSVLFMVRACCKENCRHVMQVLSSLSAWNSVNFKFNEQVLRYFNALLIVYYRLYSCN